MQKEMVGNVHHAAEEVPMFQGEITCNSLPPIKKLVKLNLDSQIEFKIILSLQIL